MLPLENIIFILISTGNDSLLYGYFYEILKLQKKNLFFKILFYEWTPSFMPKETFVPVYRLCVQWPIDILFLYHIYVNYPWWYFAMTLLAIFLAVKEFGFYLLLRQLTVAKNLIAPYWLQRIYFILGWDKPYTYRKFRNYAIAGMVILIFSNVPQIIKLF